MSLSKKLKLAQSKLKLKSSSISVYSSKFGGNISLNYWTELTNGKKKNPSANRLLALSIILGVPVRYLIDSQVKNPVDSILLEAKNLSIEELQFLIRQLESLQIQKSHEMIKAALDKILECNRRNI